MTRESTTSKISYSGNGSTVEFPITFKFAADADILVVLTDSAGRETTQTYTTDYSLTGAGPKSGGTLTMVTAPATGETLTIKRSPEIVQETDYTEFDAFPAQSHEAALDKLNDICQDLDERLERAVQLPIAYTRGAVALPLPDAGRVLRWNSAGDAIENGPDATDIENAGPFASAAASAVAASAASASASAASASASAASAVAAAAALNTLSRKNRLCNGDFRVDNINGGSAVTPSTGTSAYVVDNLALVYSQASKLTVQRVADSLTHLPYSEKVTVAVAVTPGAADYFFTRQGIEGLDVADLEWGTANAKDITIQFTVKVSVEGVYAFAVRNPAGARSYVFTATLTSGENSVVQTIPGDTSGTWPKDTAVGLYLTMDLGSGSNFETTAGAWQAGAYTRTSAAVKLISNLAATFEIGGVQIERGSFATALEVLPIQAAEAWCMRYHPCIKGSAWLSGYCTAGTVFYVGYAFPVPARIAPTGIITVVSGNVSVAAGNIDLVALTFGGASRTNGFLNYSVASGFTAGQGGMAFSGAVRWTGAEL